MTAPVPLWQQITVAEFAADQSRALVRSGTGDAAQTAILEGIVRTLRYLEKNEDAIRDAIRSRRAAADHV